MYIKSVSTNSILEKDFSIYKENGRPSYLYVLFRTKTMLLIENEYIPVNPGTGILYDKNKVQAYYNCDDTRFNHDFLYFDIENELEKTLLLSIPKGVPFIHPVPKKISDFLFIIEKESQTPSKFNREILSNLCISFLYKVLEDVDLNLTGDKEKKYYREFYNLRQNIYKNPSEKWSVENLSESLFLSKRHFQLLYKKFFGVSCINDVINARTEMAKNILLKTNLSITEVSEKCGYNNVEHFIRQFKNRVGLSPERYKLQK